MPKAKTLCEAVGQGLDVVRELIAAGADVNAVDGDSDQPVLVMAVERGDAAMVGALIAAGADVNAGGPYGVWNAVRRAADWNRADIVELLIAAGADVNVPNGDGRAPLGFAAERGNVGLMTTLIGAGANDYDDALVQAAEAGHADIVRWMIDKGAYPDVERGEEDQWDDDVMAVLRANQ